MLTGKHLIAGNWMLGPSVFENTLVEGTADQFSVGAPELVDIAAQAAEDAIWSY